MYRIHDNSGALAHNRSEAAWPVVRVQQVRLQSRILRRWLITLLNELRCSAAEVPKWWGLFPESSGHVGTPEQLTPRGGRYRSTNSPDRLPAADPRLIALALTGVVTARTMADTMIPAVGSPAGGVRAVTFLIGITQAPVVGVLAVLVRPELVAGVKF